MHHPLIAQNEIQYAREYVRIARTRAQFAQRPTRLGEQRAQPALVGGQECECLQCKRFCGFSVHGKDKRTEDTRKRLLDALRSQFRPEFLNRVDDIIVFNSLTREHLGEIVDIQLRNVGKLLRDRKLKIEVTAAAKDAIIAEGYDPQFGARPMKRAIQRLIADPLALKLITGEFLEGETILVDAKPGEAELQFSRLEALVG